MRTQEDVVVAMRDLGADQFIPFVERNRDNAARHRVIELRQLRLFDDAVLGHHHDVLLGDEILDGKERLHRLIRLEIDEVRNVLALAGGAGIGNLIRLQPVDSPAAGKDQQVAVGRCHQQVFDDIFRARAHADAALAAARLAPVGIDRSPLQIPAARYRDGDIFDLHQVFELDIAGVLDNLGPPVVAELLLDFL